MGFYEFSSPYEWSRLAGLKRAAGEAEGGMVDLSVGSPVDAVPQSVQQAVVASLDAPNAHGYPATAGTAELREAIVQWLRTARNVDVETIGVQIVPTVGSKEAVALMASLLHIGPGDVVIQPLVSYPTYEIGTQLAGANVVKVADIADVDSWRTLPNVKAVWVNSPNNPSGQVLGVEQLRAIVDAAREIGAVVLSDECYGLLDWREDSSPCILDSRVCGGSAAGVIMLYSLSKQSNLAGYRAAFLAGDSALIKPMIDYRKQIGQIIPGPMQAAMVAALGDMQSVAEQKERYRRRLQALVSALQEYGYDAHMPQGGLYVWVKVLSGDCWTDLEQLAQIGIIASPGEFYGEPQYLRFAATATDDAIDNACARLRAAHTA